jgi:hypothetical protein
MKIYATFYDRSIDYRGRLIGFLTRSNLHHCGLVLEDGDNKIVLVTDKNKKGCFLDESRFHSMIMSPVKNIYIGETIKTLDDIHPLIEKPYLGTAKALLFWFFFARFFLTWKPKSCTLLCCRMLTKLGFPTPDRVIPKDLYEHINRNRLLYKHLSNSYATGSLNTGVLPK